MTEEPERPNGAPTARYDYHDENGEVLYQVRRFDKGYGKKTFQQVQWREEEWIYNMDGARMVLFNLPEVAKSDYVWVVEGEKDALTLASIKMTATTIAGGSKGKWQSGYSESLRGKNILICGDTDEPGKEHVERIQKETKDFVRTTRVIEVPQKFKDVTEYRESFDNLSDFTDALLLIAEQAEATVKGFRVPVKSMDEMERGYVDYAKRKETALLNLGSWLPSLGHAVRPLMGGELVTIVADTGVGKTMLLQNLALHTRLTTLLFEIELPDTLTFERFAGMATQSSGGHIYSTYSTGGTVPWKATGRLNHVHTCGESRITPEDIERIVDLAGIKIGIRPALVLVDYIQLIRGKGKSRYERASEAAEEMKIVAKQTGAIVVMASQISRKGDDEAGEIFLHDAKESGSIENSSGLVLGAWRDALDKGKLYLKVLKNTKGFAGKTVTCRIKPDSMLIIEETSQEEPMI